MENTQKKPTKYEKNVQKIQKNKTKYVQQFRTANINSINLFWNSFGDSDRYTLEQLVFVDECHITTKITNRQFGYAPRYFVLRNCEFAKCFFYCFCRH